MLNRATCKAGRKSGGTTDFNFPTALMWPIEPNNAGSLNTYLLRKETLASNYFAIELGFNAEGTRQTTITCDFLIGMQVELKKRF